MRYLMFVCVDPSAEPFDPAQDNTEEWVSSNDKRGRRILGDRLDHARKAKTLRVRQGQLLVTDGPFAETKEVIGGYALLKANSKAEIVEHTKRFLEVAGQGTCEIYQLYEMPEGN